MKNGLRLYEIAEELWRSFAGRSMEIAEELWRRPSAYEKAEEYEEGPAGLGNSGRGIKSLASPSWLGKADRNSSDIS